MARKSLAGSLIGSIAETQEVLDICAEHGIAPDVQVIPIQDVNEAYKKVKSGEVRFRYVIDMASLKPEQGALAAATHRGILDGYSRSTLGALAGSLVAGRDHRPDDRGRERREQGRQAVRAHRAGGDARRKASGGDRLFQRTEAPAGLIQAALAEIPDITLPELKARLAGHGASVSVAVLWHYFRLQASQYTPV